MRGQNSVFEFNLGVHYSMSLNFTTYRDLVDSVIILLKRNVDVQNNNKPIVIWKTTTSIEKEKTYPKNLTRGDSILVRYNSKYYSFKIFRRF